MQANQIQAIINEAVEDCTKHFKARGWASDNWKCDVRVDFSNSRNRSWGGQRRGRPFISLAVGHYVGRDNADFIEYKSFRADSQIGSVKGNTARAIKALVIHEMCHAIQFSGTDRMSASFGVDKYSKDSRGHGYLWKSLYRISRSALLNSSTVNVPAPIAQSVQSPIAQPAGATMKRSDALEWIRESKRRGHSNKTIINTLVVVHNFKKTTATTYTYSV